MIIAYFTVKSVYICIFMTRSTSYCLCDALVDPWNVGMYMCMLCVTSMDNAFIDPPIHITDLEGHSVMTIAWNMHGRNLKVVGQKETERERKNKYAVTVII